MSDLSHVLALGHIAGYKCSFYYILLIAYICFYQKIHTKPFYRLITLALKEIAIYMRRQKHRPPKRAFCMA